MKDVRNNRSRSGVHRLVETGTLLALLMVLILFSLYVPVFGSLGMFLEPSILYLIIRRSGIKWGVMATIGAIFLASVIVGPVGALNVALMELIPALSFTLFLTIALKPAWVLLATTVTYLTGMIAWVIVGVTFLGISLAPETIEAQLRATMGTGFMFSHFSAEQLAEMEKLIPMMVQLSYGMMGVLFTFASALSAFVNYKITDYFSRRFTGESLKPIPSFSCWDFPRWLGMPLAVVLICSFYVGYRNLVLPFWLMNIGIFIFYVSGFLMLIQGLAVAKFLLNRSRISRFIFPLLVAALFFIPFVSVTLVFVGLADLFLDYRRIRSKLS